MTLDDDGANWVVLLTRAVQFTVLALAGYGAALGRIGVAVNGVLAFAVALLPDALAWRYDHEVDPRLALWISLGALIHTAGFLGPYDRTTGLWGLYDQVAHAVSASFVAGVGYALVDALDRSSSRVSFPEGFRFVFTLLFILAFGVAWEIGEFAGGALGRALGGTEVLVQYGISDIVADLVFNTLAAAVVAIWGTDYFADVADVVAGRVFGTENS